MRKYPLTDTRWHSIINNDTTADNKFFYGVKTTMIFCKPSCHSRKPARENVLIFKTAKEAQAANFRPCKRCQPTGNVPNTEWVDEITHFIDTNYQRKLTLDRIAEECHGSPFHLQKVFKRENGYTPAQYLTTIRLAKAKELLKNSGLSVKSIALRVGFSSDTYFITVFKQRNNQTPDEFRLENV
ncbi:bifunctional transcriptional activator/DNA repair enzyme AdaA [Companilactobacillus hulinensis]|uniref:bifunctional transcriptional activator/DNA repair enzyme AdaA n=1 Tax=Companilactobacillus hulinensis TaxID=2486007 RepID=UPI000F7669F2|nr:bifunctional transcriptional activator/DNA repair enzyme AdaA [Companilactobacillus hulinensis]